MRHLLRSAKRFLSDVDGASLIEYGLLVLLIAAICLLIVKAIGTKVSNGYHTFNSLIP